MKGTRIGVSTFALLSFLASAQAQQMPEMPASVAQFWKRIEKAKTLTYTVRAWRQDDFGMHGATPTKSVFYVESTYEFKVRRPDHLSIVRTPSINEYEVTENGGRHKAFDNYGDNIYVCDGRKSLSYSSYMRTFTIGKAPNSLSAAKLSTDSGGTYSWFHQAMDWFFDDRPLEGYKPFEDAQFPTTKYVVYLRENSAPLAYQRKKIYFDRKTGELLQISEFYKDKKGDWRESDRSEFRFWDFNPPMPSSTFDTRTPRNYRPWEAVLQELKKQEEQQKTAPASKP